MSHGPAILVVGQGGREHALVDALARSPSVPRIWSAPGNPGMEPVATRVPVGATDVEALVTWVREHRPDLVVIGPDAAIAEGVGDAMRAEGVRALGPDRAPARLEWSKRFAKDLMADLGLPTATYQVAETAEKADRWIDSAPLPLVLKADGLAAGKGVVIARDRDEARSVVDAWMRRGTLGDAGRTLILEEHLVGEEASLFLLADGERWMLLPTARDHKRLLDGDRGPNTGGMGAYAPAGALPEREALSIAHRIADPLLARLRGDGTPYRGVLYVGLMMTRDGPRVLEFNARFGDPEAQVILPLVTEDLCELFSAAAGGALPAERHGTPVRHEGAAVCVILAARGYPARPERGAPIGGLDGPWDDGVSLYYAGVEREGRVFKTAGGRVLGVTARRATRNEARIAAYGAVARISFDGVQYRRDIAGAPMAEGSVSR